jgi:signal transduction histidine kinase
LEELVDERSKALEEAQETLLKSQRLAAIGEAAAMVGHDLRNPLQTIVNTLYLAEKKANSSPNNGLEGMLKNMKKQVDYINKIVSDLQDYARQLKPTLIKVNLPSQIKDTLSTIMIPENVDVAIEIPENFKLLLDPSLMKRVFTNLITNALQAMPEGGLLTIRASNTEGNTLISFQDTGIGISEQNLDKIFQPLFTTKSKGQGLGLAVCKRLVEAMNGIIMVESNLGKGTTFTLKIPITRK